MKIVRYVGGEFDAAHQDAIGFLVPDQDGTKTIKVGGRDKELADKEIEVADLIIIDPNGGAGTVKFNVPAEADKLIGKSKDKDGKPVDAPHPYYVTLFDTDATQGS